MEAVNVIATKKGRKPISGDAMSPAQRQRRARSFAMKQLCDGNETEISTSGLIALLPKLISDSNKSLITSVCKEIIKREGK